MQCSILFPQDLTADYSCSCASGFTGRNCAQEEEEGKGEVTAPLNNVLRVRRGSRGEGQEGKPAVGLSLDSRLQLLLCFGLHWQELYRE